MLIKVVIGVISYSPGPRDKIHGMVGRPVKSSHDSLANKRKVLSFFGESKCSILGVPKVVDGIIQGVDKHLGVKKGSTRNFKYMRSCLTSASP